MVEKRSLLRAGTSIADSGSISLWCYWITYLAVETKYHDTSQIFYFLPIRIFKNIVGPVECTIVVFSQFFSVNPQVSEQWKSNQEILRLHFVIIAQEPDAL